MDEVLLKSRLKDVGLSAIRYFDSIGSTNDFALKWIEQGAADRSLVFADHQTAGRGRMQRRWITEPDSALAFSLVLRPTAEEIPHVQLFSPLGALAICEALEAYGLKAQIKWPNDVLLEGKKTAGILLEAIWRDSQPQAVVIGIGVNVAPQSIPTTEALLFPATCIESGGGKHVDRLDLLYNILAQYLRWRPRLTSDSFLHAWEARLAYRDEWVQIEQPGDRQICGRVSGIQPDGNLLIRDNQDKIISVAAGDLHLRPIQGNHPATPGGSENVR